MTNSTSSTCAGSTPSRCASPALYSPKDEKDNCGFGLIAHLQGIASHNLLQTSIGALARMTHRGAVAADGKTGDGCGLLFKKPDAFFRSEAELLFGKQLAQNYAVGNIFLSNNPEQATQSKKILTNHLNSQNIQIVGWRLVPVDESVLGEIAKSCKPHIEQIFVEACENMSKQEFESALFMARKRTEATLKTDEDFYITSLSVNTVIYKGLTLPADLPNFYLDLQNPAVETSICIFHQRFSTNTMPRWSLAQPFRYLAHNGEINTITANRSWSNARKTNYICKNLPEIDTLEEMVNTSGSDSSSMDNMLEILTLGGMDYFRAIRMLMPPAWQNVQDMDASLRAFFEYNSLLSEPWDGPAGVVSTNGRYAVCFLDRNGLRPARFVHTKNGYITLASEIGVWDYEECEVISKGRVGPGQILAVDTLTGDLLHTGDIDNQLKQASPYKEWLKQESTYLESSLIPSVTPDEVESDADLIFLQKMFNFSFEERQSIILPLALDASEAIGSMGDDTPMAVLSQKVRHLADYFRQKFAQVTNPPIDPLREAIVMSLETVIGKQGNVFEDSQATAHRIILTTPILSHRKFKILLHDPRPLFAEEVFKLGYKADEENLQSALQKLCTKVEASVRSGKVILILSDNNLEKDLMPINAVLATGALHQHLVKKGLRPACNLIIDTAWVRDAHHAAVLFGLGATAIHPWLSYQVIIDFYNKGFLEGRGLPTSLRSYRKGIQKGMFKILSKMGISTLSSYRGSQLFEAIGLADEIIQTCAPQVASKLGGAEFVDLEEDQKILFKQAHNLVSPINYGGLLRYHFEGEYHAFNPDVIQTLQVAVRSGAYEDFEKFARLVNNRGVATIRDLLRLKTESAKPISIDEVESVEELLTRFDSAGMSLGALSPEAHEALAQAMNELGARSNSGEGGEASHRYGTSRSSKIKQIASGRFGVTPNYLVNAEVLQIKVAQGAKPGEGGQLPGHKVNHLIAELRHSVEGVTLISPPPHHDIYSIEDLAQLIFDLKQINPRAQISVKLVAEAGIGTIATGVAKAYADLITVSGYDGGTAASPLTSIKYAGSPWELGLTETHQALRANGLRHKIRLQTDGGLKTGLDVIKAAILGAESFGFGTAPMVALGCRYLRICHLNNCATGIATQDKNLRDHYFRGTVDMVKNYFLFIAKEVRELLASLGVKRLVDLIGRTDLLEIIENKTVKQSKLDLSPLLATDYAPKDEPQYCSLALNEPLDKGELANKMLQETKSAIDSNSGGNFEYKVKNTDRSIGAKLSGYIAKLYGDKGLDNPLNINLQGVAGQSFGVFNSRGLNLTLTGDANDYVGKGMAGGRLVLLPEQEKIFMANKSPILGNTCLYGATGGILYAEGRAGERFAVRNSGALAVVEGAGDHCCEYMTGGIVVVLGKVGKNFGAGMTGGIAFVLDLDKEFVDLYNEELVVVKRINTEAMEAWRFELRNIIKDYVMATNSAWGKKILEDFADFARHFWVVLPKSANLEELLKISRERTE